MRVLIAARALGAPGGSETYALTVAEHIARLGHPVTLAGRSLGATAEAAREQGFDVVGEFASLDEAPDAVLVQDRTWAIELAERFPDAVRVFISHGIDDHLHLPPPITGAVAASVALNERTALRLRAFEAAGEVVRMRQPIDLRRFGARGGLAARPKRALVLGNYLQGARLEILQEAWEDVELVRVGMLTASDLDPAERMARVDIVVGYGRSILEAMAAGRPAFVYDHSGADGWVTPDTYPRLEADGFAGTQALPMTVATLREQLDRWDPQLGRFGQDLIRSAHDARMHAAELIGLLDRLSPTRAPAAAPLREMALLAELQFRAEHTADEQRMEAHRQVLRAQAEAEQAQARVNYLLGMRRVKLGVTLARPLDAIRRLFRR
jgi:hypothetical protein